MDDRQRLIFTPNWKVSIACALLLPLLVGLGFWQLSRAEEKQALKSAFEQRQRALPVPVEELMVQATENSYRRVELRGRFDNDHNWLLDNRVYQGRVGYEVLSPFQLVDGRWLVVNRGWIAGDPARRRLPGVPLVDGTVLLLGVVQPAHEKTFRLGADNPASGWPRAIQVQNLELMSQSVPYPLASTGVWLDASSPGALQPNWQVINVSPAKHQAYALQWFAMAFALVVMYLLASTNVRGWWSARRNRRNSHEHE